MSILKRKGLNIMRTNKKGWCFQSYRCIYPPELLIILSESNFWPLYWGFMLFIYFKGGFGEIKKPIFLEKKKSKEGLEY